MERIEATREEFIKEGLDRNGITEDQGIYYKQWSSWKETITEAGFNRYNRVLGEAYNLGSRY
jgi:hypothetical protein